MSIYLYKNGAWAKQNAYERQNGQWVQVSNAEASAITLTKLSTTLPGAGIFADAITIGTKIWLFGSGGARPFDPDTYTLLDTSVPLSPTYSWRSLSAIGTKVYLFGGYNVVTGSYSESVSTISVFDTETGTMQDLSARLPTAAHYITSAAVGSKIYLFGGWHTPRQNYTDSYYCLNTINVFDTETNTITKLSVTLPMLANRMAAEAVGKKIYLFGGMQSSLTNYYNTIIVFDTETSTVQTLSATLPQAAYFIGSAAVEKKIYLFGGALDSQSTPINTINVFDTETNKIETLNETLPTATYGISAAAMGSNIYLFGGGGLDTIIEVQT